MVVESEKFCVVGIKAHREDRKQFYNFNSFFRSLFYEKTRPVKIAQKTKSPFRFPGSVNRATYLVRTNSYRYSVWTRFLVSISKVLLWWKEIEKTKPKDYHFNRYFCALPWIATDCISISIAKWQQREIGTFIAYVCIWFILMVESKWKQPDLVSEKNIGLSICSVKKGDGKWFLHNLRWHREIYHQSHTLTHG